MTLTAAETKELEKLAHELERTKPRIARVIRKVIAVPASAAAAEDDYVSVGEAARILHVSDQTVRNWAATGWLRAIRRGPLGRRLVLRSSLDAVQRFDAVRLTPETTITEDHAARMVQQHRRERART